MAGRPTRRRRRIQTVHDLANDDGCIKLRIAAEVREEWRQRQEGCHKPVQQHQTTGLNSLSVLTATLQVNLG